MRREKRSETKKNAMILMLFVLIVIGLLIRRVQPRQETGDYLQKAITITEIKEELSFSLYEKTDWNEFFEPYHKEYLTGEILIHLLTKLGVSEYIEVPNINERHVVAREEWNDIYEQMLDFLDMEHVVRKDKFLVLDVIKAEDGTILITNQGEYYTHLPEEYFIRWQGYEVYCTQDNCIGITGICEEEFYIENAYLTKVNKNEIYFLYSGAAYQKGIGVLEDTVEKGVCDIVLKSGEVCALRMKQDTIEGELLSYNNDTIEISGYGKIQHSGRIPVYRTYGEIIEKSISDIIIGNMKVTYVTGENQVCAILINQPADIQNVRVLLLDEDGTNERESVYLKSDVETRLTCGEHSEQIALETVIDAKQYLERTPNETVILRTDSSEGKIYICDKEGNVKSNGYEGSMEVRLSTEGYTLVNEVPFETYLCAVVPSEMPSNYEPEALKAQAVCARSYAYLQLLHADLAAYGAHINDSTSYQVYNKIPATDASCKAVYETTGQMLLYDGKPIEAYYFSTSMGYTDSAKVWNVEDESIYGYLKSVCLNEGEPIADLSNEETFYSYISQPAVGYDSDCKYYRWFAQADYRGKTEQMNQILIDRYAILSKNISFFKEDDETELEDISVQTVGKLGKIVDISVEERSNAGSILTLRIQYEKGSAVIKNEYNIRKVLGICVDKMIYADATENTNVTMMPSAFFSIVKQKDGSLLLQGGGFGHGLGMGQNAANGMAKAGMSYEEILQYFYQNITIGSAE